MVADGITLEQTVIGHALNDDACYDLFISELEYTSFAAANHKVLAFCLKQMGAMGIRKPDEDAFQLVVNSYPGEDEKDYGGAEYLRNLQSAFLQPTENYQLFVDKLKLQAAKAQVNDLIVKRGAGICNDPSTTTADLHKLVAEMHEVVEGANTSGFLFKDTETLAEQYLDEIEKRKDLPFHSCGFDALDEHLAEGFAPQQVTVMGGFTGMAKSTVAINMAHRLAVQGTGVALFSMESTDMSMMDKVVSTLTQIPLSRLKKESADLNDQERESIAQAVNSISNLPLLINDQASLSLDGMLYQLEAARRRGYDPKVVFIDLFGKIEDVDTGDNLATRIQKEMKRLRVLAKTLKIHFVAIVQIGRQGFGRQRGGQIRRPTLIDIKNANAYAEEANLVILLHRNKYYLHDLEEDILEFDIAKQRDGEANIKVYFEFFPDTSTIMNTDRVPHDVPDPAEAGAQQDGD